MTPTDILRRAVAYLAGAACLWRVLDACLDAFRANGAPLATAFICAVLGPLGVGLLGMHRLARRVAAWLCLLVAIMLPVGAINPFSAMELEPAAPSLASILLWLVPAVVGLIIMAWALDPPRKLQE